MAEMPSRRVELMRSVPPDSWIAMSKDESRIVGVGRTFLEADSTARSAGESDYFITRAPDVWSSKVFHLAR